jgi:hypothetical protein
VQWFLRQKFLEKTAFRYCGPTRPFGTVILITFSESFFVNVNFSGAIILAKKFFLDFLHKWFKHMYMQNCIFLLWPHLTPRATILTTVNLHYTLYQKGVFFCCCKSKLFLARCFVRMEFLIDRTLLLHLVFISHSKKTWPFIWTNLRSLHTQEWFVPNLVEINLLFLEEIFSKYKHM